MRFTAISLFFLLFTVFSASVRADEFRPIFRDYGAVSFYPNAGIYVFPKDQTIQVNDSNHQLNHALSLSMRFGYEITGNFELETAFNYVPTNHNLADVNIYIYNLDLVYNIINFGRVTPYVDLGVGAMTFTSALNFTQTDPLITYGAGLKFFILENLAFKVDARAYTKFGPTATNLNFTGGLIYYASFKKIKDTDKDGFPDRFDLCPNIKESFNDYIDEDGCPETGKK